MEQNGLANLALSSNGFLFDATTGHTYTLNKTGTFILKSLIGGATTEDLAEKLMEKFDVAPDTARDDIEQFLVRLSTLGLIPE